MREKQDTQAVSLGRVEVRLKNEMDVRHDVQHELTQVAKEMSEGTTMVMASIKENTNSISELTAISRHLKFIVEGDEHHEGLRAQAVKQKRFHNYMIVAGMVVMVILFMNKENIKFTIGPTKTPTATSIPGVNVPPKI